MGSVQLSLKKNIQKTKTKISGADSVYSFDIDACESRSQQLTL